LQNDEAAIPTAVEAATEPSTSASATEQPAPLEEAVVPTAAVVPESGSAADDRVPALAGGEAASAVAEPVKVEETPGELGSAQTLNH